MPFAVHPGPDDPIEPCLHIPPPGCEVTERYDEIDVSAWPGVPLFRVVHSIPRPERTPEQVRALRQDTEQYYLHLSIWRFWARLAANELGYPARCGRAACRRRGGCAGNRHEFDWSFPGPWMPPCAATIRLVDEVRDLIRRRVREAIDEGARTER